MKSLAAILIIFAIVVFFVEFIITGVGREE